MLVSLKQLQTPSLWQAHNSVACFGDTKMSDRFENYGIERESPRKL